MVIVFLTTQAKKELEFVFSGDIQYWKNTGTWFFSFILVEV